VSSSRDAALAAKSGASSLIFGGVLTLACVGASMLLA
jgi:hypothetical protein